MKPMSPTFTGSSDLLAAVIVLLVTVVTVAGTATIPGTAGTNTTSKSECDSMFDLNGPALYLPAAENTTVSGDSRWPPGTNVSVTLTFQNRSGGTMRNDSVVVDHQGDWEAAFDLSGVEEGRAFVASLHRDGAVVDTVEGEVGTPTATVTFENQSAPPGSSTVVVQRVRLDLGGFVAIHRDSIRGPIVGVSDYLEPGIHESITVELRETYAGQRRLVASPHKDSNCNELWNWPANSDDDGPYVENGTKVTAAATVRFPTPTPSPTLTPTPPPTSDTQPPASPSPPDPATRTTPPAGTTTAPGLGIEAALLSVAGGALLLWRNR